MRVLGHIFVWVCLWAYWGWYVGGGVCDRHLEVCVYHGWGWEPRREIAMLKGNSQLSWPGKTFHCGKQSSSSRLQNKTAMGWAQVLEAGLSSLLNHLPTVELCVLWTPLAMPFQDQGMILGIIHCRGYFLPQFLTALYSSATWVDLDPPTPFHFLASQLRARASAPHLQVTQTPLCWAAVWPTALLYMNWTEKNNQR